MNQIQSKIFSTNRLINFDGDSDFKIWVSGVGCFGIKFGRSIDIRKTLIMYRSKAGIIKKITYQVPYWAFQVYP